MNSFNTMFNINNFDLLLEYKTYIDSIESARDKTKNKRQEILYNKNNLQLYIPIIINKFHRIEFKDLITPSDKEADRALWAAIRLIGVISSAEGPIETILYCLASNNLSPEITLSGYMSLISILIAFFSEIKYNNAISKRIIKDLEILANTLKNKLL